MPDDLTELLDTAIYKEIAAQAVYEAGIKKTHDPAAKTLMKELAKEELGHTRKLKKLKEEGFSKKDWHHETVPNLLLSEHLTGGETLEDISFQDLLITAMKREQQAVEFYARMMGVLRGTAAKQLCEGLVHEELKHKLRLETLYDELFYGED